MIKVIMDADGHKWQDINEYRIAGPFEYYIEPYSNIYTGNYPKIIHTGERQTQRKVFVVTPLNNIASKTWSNH